MRNISCSPDYIHVVLKFMLERVSICQGEIQKLLHEQSVKDLEAQIKSLEGDVRGLEARLREKQEAIVDGSKALKTQKQKTHRVTDKVCAG